MNLSRRLDSEIDGSPTFPHSKSDKDRLGQHCGFLAVRQRHRHHEYLPRLCR